MARKGVGSLAPFLGIVFCLVSKLPKQDDVHFMDPDHPRPAGVQSLHHRPMPQGTLSRRSFAEALVINQCEPQDVMVQGSDLDLCYAVGSCYP
jgi:hypothetical protein